MHGDPDLLCAPGSNKIGDVFYFRGCQSSQELALGGRREDGTIRTGGSRDARANYLHGGPEGIFRSGTLNLEERRSPTVVVCRRGRCCILRTAFCRSNGEVITAISLDFQATNVSDGVVQISAVRLRWPRVSRRAIRDTMFLVESPAPRDPTYSRRNPILAHTLKNVSVHFTIGHAIGRPGQTMRVVTIKVQDHARNWYWLTFRNVKSGPAVPESAAPTTTATP
jgi:hypothetical protein